MNVANRIGQRHLGVAILFAILTAGSPAAHAASGQVATIATGTGDKVTVAGDAAIRCVYDGKLTCTSDAPTAAPASSRGLIALGGEVSRAVVKFVVVFFNTSAVPVLFDMNGTAPTMIPTTTLLGGSVAGSVTDALFTGVGGVASSGMDPIYVGLIDGMPVAGTALNLAPFAVPGSGMFAFRGATQTVAPAAFGLPGPSTVGPTITNSMGIRLRFQLAPGSEVGFTSMIVAESDAAAMSAGTGGTAYDLASTDLDCANDAGGSTCTGDAAAGVKSDVPLEGWNLSVQAGESGCPVLIFCGVGAVAAPADTTFTITCTTLVPAIAGSSLIGGSAGGAVLDSGLNGSGGIRTVAPDAIFTALIDGAPVATLYPDPFFAPPGLMFPGSFPFAGAAVNIAPMSFGLPGPTMPGPAVASTLSIRFKFTLAAGDSAEMTSMFVVDCVPTPTSTPTATPTATQTQTASHTPTVTPTGTPVPVGGPCTDTSQCVAGLFCADRVCCTSPCDGPSQRCDVRPNVGICSDVAAPAPTLSPRGLIVALTLLLAVAALAFGRRARS